MKTFNSKKSKVLLSVFVIAIAISIISLLFFLIFNEKNKENLDKKRSENIQVNYPESNDPEIKSFIEKDIAYQEKITTLDFTNYDMPSSKVSNAEENTKCENGFGGQMPNIQNGIFNEPLYSLDAEKIATDNNGVAYAPYVNAYYVVGDILFKKPLDLFDRKLLTYEQLTRNFSDSRVIIGNKSFKNSFSTMESKFGFPQAYLKQQAGLVVSLSAFNDSCVKEVGGRNIHFDRVDLSGLPITALFSSKYKTSLFHGVNGLYNYTDKSSDFVSLEFLDWIHSNNLIYQNLINNRMKNVFPKGSYMFVPVKYAVLQEMVTVDFKAESLNAKLQDILSQIAKENNLDLSLVTYSKEEFKDFTIYKPIKKINYEKLTNFAIAEKEGKLYMTTWELPITVNVNGLEPDRSNLVVMNSVALKSALELIKSNYQGKKFDVGTINENLDINAIKAQSDESVADLQEKKRLMMDVLKDEFVSAEKPLQH